MAPAKQTLPNANSKWINREAGANKSCRHAGANLPAPGVRKKFWTNQNFVSVQPRVVQVVHELFATASRFIHLLLAFDSVCLAGSIFINALQTQSTRETQCDRAFR